MMLSLAWRNLWRHPRRTWLTASAIALITTLLVFLITIQLGTYDMLIESTLRVFTGQMQVQRQGYLDKPQMRMIIQRASGLAAGLRQETGLSGVAPRAYGFVLASSGRRSYGVPVVGVEPEYESRVSTIPHKMIRGLYLSSPLAQEAVLGATLAQNLMIEVGEEITLLGSGMDGSVAATVLPVVGMFESGVPDLDRNMMQIPLRTFQQIFSMGDAGHVIVIAGVDLEQLPRFKEDLSRLLPPADRLVALDWDQLVPGLKQLVQADWLSGWFTYLALIVVVTFSILNTFLMSVLERTREFGVLLALGISPMRLGSMVVLESALLTLLGLVVGMALGGSIAFYFSIHGLAFPGMKELHAHYGLPGILVPKLTLVSITIGPAVVFVLTLAASLYPASRIRRLNAVEAMRAI